MRKIYLSIILVLWLAFVANAETYSYSPSHVTPEQYGAVGNGVTDDTTAFTLALTACTGGILELNGNKNYLVAGNFTATSTTMPNIIGNGAKITLSANDEFMTISGTSNSVPVGKIMNVHFVVPTGNTASVIKYAVSSGHIMRPVLDKVSFHDSSYGSTSGTWTAVELSASSSYGIVYPEFDIEVRGAANALLVSGSSGAWANAGWMRITGECNTNDILVNENCQITGMTDISLQSESCNLSGTHTGINAGTGKGYLYGNNINITHWKDSTGTANAIDFNSNCDGNRIFGCLQADAITDAGDNVYLRNTSANAGGGGLGTTTNRLGMGISAPTARLHLGGGTATAGTAPLKITPGTNLTAAESGAIESDGTHIYWTDSDATRLQLDQQSMDAAVTASATAPVTPEEGRFWIQATTGRIWLWQYANSKWNPIRSYGATTIYVDSSGTDSVNSGTGTTTDAFDTLQYALNALPPMLGGDVTINIASGTYQPGASIYLSGKYNAGQPTAPTITIQGVLTATATAAQDSAVAGSGGTRGSITDAGGFDSADVGKLLYSSNNSEYRVVYAADANSNTIVGTWTAEPSGNYTRYDWGTILDFQHTFNGLYIYDMGVLVSFKNIKFYDPLNYLVYTAGIHMESVSFERCRFETSASSSASRMAVLIGPTFPFTFTQCSFIPTANNETSVGVYTCRANFTGCLFANTSSSTGNILIDHCGFGNFGGGTSILHSGPQSTGVTCQRNSIAIFNGVSTSGYEGIAGCTTGISALTGGQVTGTTNNIYSGNSADETATAASFGYID